MPICNALVHNTRHDINTVVQISLWWVESILIESTAYFDRISNSIERLLVGRAPGGLGVADIYLKVLIITLIYHLS